MLISVLVGWAVGGKGVVIIQHAKVGAGFRPEIVRFGWVNVWIVAAWSRQYTVVAGGERNLLTDADSMAIDGCDSGSVYQTIDERCIRILENLLDRAGELVRWLRPVMVFHRDNENGFKFFRAGAGMAQRDQQSKDGQHEETSYVRHFKAPYIEDVRRTLQSGSVHLMRP